VRYHFTDFTLDCDLYELRKGDARVEIQPKVLSFLRLLADNSMRTLAKDEILDALWPDVMVADASLQRIASLARQALSSDPDDGIIKTVRGIGYRLDTEVRIEHVADDPARYGRDEETAPPRPLADRAAPSSPVRLQQTIRFCKTVDGINLAWATAGSGPPLLRSLGWFSNLEMEWQWDAGRRFWEKLARNHTLIRYDGRGIGLSDPAERFTVETRLRDLEAVADASGHEKFAIVALSEGCASAIAFAARHPDRVSHLVLVGTPESVVRPISEARMEWGSALIGIVQQAWGGNSPTFGRFLANLFLGASATPEMLDYFDRMQRASASRELAVRYTHSLGALNVSDAAATIRAPTLVVHRVDDELCPFAAGRELAKLIPGASFAALEGDNHWLLLDDPKADSFIAVVEDFLST